MKKSPIYILIATIIWGSTFPLMKLSLNYINPVFFNFLRFIIASIIFFPISYKSIAKSGKNEFFKGLILGIFVTSGYIFQIIGLKYTDPDSSTFITSLYIVIAPILAYFFLKEDLKTKNIFSLILAIIGLLIFSQAYEYGLNFGDILTLISAISYGFQVVLIDKYSKEIDIMVLSSYQLFFVTIFTAALLPLYGIQMKLNLELIFIVIYISIFATALALFLQILGQKDLDAKTASFIFVFEPVFGAIFSYLITNEKFNFLMIIGSILILIASIVSIYQKNH
ncbi:MAG: DMT family transporter [Thermoplasmata archaeon]